MRARNGFWFNMIDEVLSGTVKADRVPSDMNIDMHVGVDEQPLSQPKEDL